MLENNYLLTFIDVKGIPMTYQIFISLMICKEYLTLVNDV